jgi:hypothetical protein
MELDRMGSSIHYPGKDISSAVIRVKSALIGGNKFSFDFTINRSVFTADFAD